MPGNLIQKLSVMKVRSLLVLVLSSITSHASITISGTGVTGVKTSNGTTNIPVGTLGLVIVDTAGDGFFNLGNPVSNTALTVPGIPELIPSDANLAMGSTFGGETILNVLTSPGGGTFTKLLNSRSIAGLEGMNFAVVWFSDILTAEAPSSAPVGATWGIIRGSDWTLPLSDSGTYTMDPTDSRGVDTYYQVNALTGGSPATAFRTTVNGTIGGASFSIVGLPEPSTALLGAMGVLGLLRRRRN